MKIEEQLVQEVSAAFQALYGSEVPVEQLQIQKTRKDFEGDFTLVVFPLLRMSKKSPEQTAEEIGKQILTQSDFIERYNVVKGFLNISLPSSTWVGFLESTFEEERFGFQLPGTKGKVMVEFSSPNTNKPLHLGHLRNNFIGDAVSRIFEANGKEVVRTQIINDRGIHICKSMLAWKKFGGGETPESTGMKGDKLVGKYYVRFDQEYKKEVDELVAQGIEEDAAKKEAPILKEAQSMLIEWEDQNPEIRALWEKMNGWVYEGFDTTYASIGVDFDKLYYESDTYIVGKDKVLENEEHPSFYRKEDGSVWIDLAEEKMDSKLLLRSDGTSVYMTQDIGTAMLREEEFHCDSYYYVVGNEQDYHFKVLAHILQKMGFDWAKDLTHISYGMVDLPSGKMKSREGTVVDADDLVLEMEETAAKISQSHGKIDELNADEQKELYHMIGLGALKYFILKVDPKKRMLFDPEDSVDFNGNTAPFIQYTHARIRSILRKNQYNKALPMDMPSIPLAEEDRALVRMLYDFPDTLKEAGVQKSPALIANYTYDFVKTFNHFYQNTPPILKETSTEVKNFRLNLCAKSADLIKNSMSLLGINVPERM